MTRLKRSKTPTAESTAPDLLEISKASLEFLLGNESKSDSSLMNTEGSIKFHLMDKISNEKPKGKPYNRQTWFNKNDQKELVAIFNDIDIDIELNEKDEEGKDKNTVVKLVKVEKKQVKGAQNDPQKENIIKTTQSNIKPSDKESRTPRKRPNQKKDFKKREVINSEERLISVDDTTSRYNPKAHFGSITQNNDDNDKKAQNRNLRSIYHGKPKHKQVVTKFISSFDPVISAKSIDDDYIQMKISQSSSKSQQALKSLLIIDPVNKPKITRLFCQFLLEIIVSKQSPAKILLNSRKYSNLKFLKDLKLTETQRLDYRLLKYIGHILLWVIYISENSTQYKNDLVNSKLFKNINDFENLLPFIWFENNQSDDQLIKLIHKYPFDLTIFQLILKYFNEK